MSVDEDPPFETCGFRDRDGNVKLEIVTAQDALAWEAQGAIVDRTQEHLGGADRGVTILRKLVREQIELVKAGKDPLGTIRDPAREHDRRSGRDPRAVRPLQDNPGRGVTTTSTNAREAVEASLTRIAEREAVVQAWEYVDGDGARAAGGGTRSGGPALRLHPRRQRSHSTSKGCRRRGGRRSTPATSPSVMRACVALARAAGRRSYRQDRYDGVRLRRAEQDAQSVESRPNAGRLVERLGRRRRRRARARRLRNADPWLRAAPGVVLRRRRLQADVCHGLARRRALVVGRRPTRWAG